MWLPAWLLFLAGAIGSTQQQQSVTRHKRDTGEKRVVCYYTNWSVYRPGTAKFNPQNINPYLCTHLIYAFGGLSKENSLKPFDKYQDIEQGGYAKFNGLKTYNKNLKTLLAIGGWNEGSARFSPLVADADRRKEFVRNIIKFLRQNHFDGLDLDWEYPSFRDGGKTRDRDNYATLVQELREEFDRESEKTGRTKLLLTMAVPAGIEYIDKGYDVPRLNEHLDWMNILSYDYHSAFEPTVDHHAPLLATEPEGEYNFGSQLNIDATVQHYLKLGADRDKLVLGIPTYGRSYTLFNPDATDIGSPADGPGEQGEATREKGYLAYYEICEQIKSEDWTVRKVNPEVMGPYAYKGNQWVGYDDEDIVRAKAKYVAENDLGGIMFWSIDNDDFRGKCSGRPYPLIEAAKEALITASNELAPSRSTAAAPVKSSEKSKDKTSTGNRPKNRKKTKTSTTESDRKVAKTTSTPVYSTTTPKPPTTPDPGSDFVCKDEGFFPHPRDCKKYFWCLDSGPSSLGVVAHQFTCPSGLVFNKISDSCDYARNVICKNKPEATTTSVSASTTPTTTTVKGKSVITASPPKTTTARTTTTTTESAEYDEDYDEDEEEEDPNAIKELLGLIKRLGGVEQLEKQLNLQSSAGKQNSSVIKASLYSKVLGGRVGNKFRGISQDSSSSSPIISTSTQKYNSFFRNRPVGPQHPEKVSSKPIEKPQYVTIQRNRIPSKKPNEEEVEEESEEEEEAEEEEQKPTTSRPKEYSSLRRNKPTNSDESQPPRWYKTIQRPKASTKKEEQPEEEEPVVVEEKAEPKITTRKKYSSVYRDRQRQEEASESKEEPAVSTTSTRLPSSSPSSSSSPFRRTTSSNYLTNLRTRIRSTTASPTTTTTVATTKINRRQGVRRKFRPETRSSTVQSDIETSTARASPLVRRRTRPTTTSTTTTTTTTTTQAPATILVGEEEEEDLPELADPAVVAIHNLAAVAPVPVRETLPPVLFTATPRPQLFTNSFVGSTAAPIFTPVASSLVRSSQDLTGKAKVATSFSDFRQGTTRIFNPSTTPRGVVESFEVPSTRQEIFVSPKQTEITTLRTTTKKVVTSKPAQSRRLTKPFSKIPKGTATVVKARGQENFSDNDYEYYDDDDPLANVPPSALKVKVHSDGYIECLDQGNFPHPFSCKKFISCAKMDNTELLGWEYTCPKHLSFDPVGGICNWSAGLGCQH